MKADIFDELFVLELANNHWGQLDRGMKIINEFSKIVRFNNVKAAIKLQLRDVDNFVHKDFRDRIDIRYVKKTMDTKMPKDDYIQLANLIKANNCIRMATAFDEASAALCVDLGIDIIKIASSDINDWFVIAAIAETRKPVIASTAGCSLKNIDDIVRYFENRDIPLALNHCIAIYPTPPEDSQLNQIDFLVNRYPNNVIGLSSHEDRKREDYTSIIIGYAKGARTFERHIDLEGYDEKGITPYCLSPEQINKWFEAFARAKELCGADGRSKIMSRRSEIEYLQKLHRGAYARRELSKGHPINHDSVADDFYLAIPCQEGQVSCKTLANNTILKRDLQKDEALMITDL